MPPSPHFTATDYYRLLLLQNKLTECHTKQAWASFLHDPNKAYSLFYRLRAHGIFLRDGYLDHQGHIQFQYRIHTPSYYTLLHAYPLFRLWFLCIIERELATNAFAHFTEPTGMKRATLRNELFAAQKEHYG